MPTLVLNYLWDSKSHCIRVPRNPNGSHGTQKPRVQSCPKAWYLPVPVPSGQRESVQIPVPLSIPGPRYHFLRLDFPFYIL